MSAWISEFLSGWGTDATVVLDAGDAIGGGESIVVVLEEPFLGGGYAPRRPAKRVRATSSIALLGPGDALANGELFEVIGNASAAIEAEDVKATAETLTVRCDSVAALGAATASAAGAPAVMRVDALVLLEAGTAQTAEEKFELRIECRRVVVIAGDVVRVTRERSRLFVTRDGLVKAA